MSSPTGGGEGFGQLEEVTQEGNTTRLVVKRDDGAPNLVIQITNECNTGHHPETKAQTTNVISQLLKAVSVSEEDKVHSDKKKIASKLDAVAAADRKAKAKELREKNLTPLMRAAKGQDGNTVRKEIIQIRKRNNRENGGDTEMLEKYLNEAEPEMDGKVYFNSNPGKDGRNDKSATKHSNTDSAGWAAVHFACDNANYDGLRYLLDAGANPNLTERMGATPLHLVIIAAGRYPIEQKLMNGKIEVSQEAGEKNVYNCSFDNFSRNRTALSDGVKTTKSGAKLKAEGRDHLNKFLRCIKLLLENKRFELLKNDRREDEYNASKPPTPTKKKGYFDPVLKSLPKDDGFGISPLCLCVCQGYTGKDALYPLLELLLTRGFDPNAKLCGFSALQIALRNMHYGCAFALTRAGANVNEPHREDGKTPLQAAELIFGDAFARELREASVVALAVADPIRRRDMLRTQGAEGAKKLAKRAMNAGHSFVKTSRWREAAGAYTEAALYGPDALSMEDRFECLRNMSECYLQVERGMKVCAKINSLICDTPLYVSIMLTQTFLPLSTKGGRSCKDLS